MSPLGEDPVDVLSDTDLAEHIARLCKETGRTSHVVSLSDLYFAKRYYKREDVDDAKSAILKASELGISVPKIKRVLPCGDDVFEIIQTNTHGQDLMAIWPYLGLLSTARLVLQLGGMCGVCGLSPALQQAR